MENKKSKKGWIIGGIVTGLLAAVGVTVAVVKSKKTDTDTDNSAGSGGAGGAGGSGSGGAGGAFLSTILNTGVDVISGANQGGAGTVSEGYVADVVYLVDRSNNGVVLDPNVMEIRFNTDHANVSVGETIKLVGAGAAYDGTFPVIEVWGSNGDAKTAMVKKTAKLGATAKYVPVGTKVFKVPSGSSFSGKNKDVCNEVSKHNKIH